MGVRVIGLRYFNVFGEKQSSTYAGVIKKFVKKVRSNEAPIINGDGQQTRDFVYVGDVVNANILAMDSNVDHEFFNIGTATTITILELANLIIKSFNLSLKPIHQKYNLVAIHYDRQLAEYNLNLQLIRLG